MTPHVRSYVRSLRWPLGIAALYDVLWLVFAARSEHHGLLSPSGDVDAGFAMLALIVLGLRLIVLFVIPAVVAYGVAMRVLTGDTKRAKGDTSGG